MINLTYGHIDSVQTGAKVTIVNTFAIFESAQGTGDVDETGLVMTEHHGQNNSCPNRRKVVGSPGDCRLGVVAQPKMVRTLLLQAM